VRHSSLRGGVAKQRTACLLCHRSVTLVGLWTASRWSGFVPFVVADVTIVSTIRDWFRRIGKRLRGWPLGFATAVLLCRFLSAQESCCRAAWIEWPSVVQFTLWFQTVRVFASSVSTQRPFEPIHCPWRCKQYVSPKRRHVNDCNVQMSVIRPLINICRGTAIT
jgi:hypothetical protein